MTTTKEQLLREMFNSKMDYIEYKIGTHPKIKITMMAGPENAEHILDMMFVVFLSGYDTAINLKGT